MNFFHHKDLGNHLLQLCSNVVKHPVFSYLVQPSSSELTPSKTNLNSVLQINFTFPPYIIIISTFINQLIHSIDTIFFFSNGRYTDYISLTYATNKNRILEVTRLSKKKGSCRISIVRRTWLLGNTSSPQWNLSRPLLHAVQPPWNHGQKPSRTMYRVI